MTRPHGGHTADWSSLLMSIPAMQRSRLTGSSQETEHSTHGLLNHCRLSCGTKHDVLSTSRFEGLRRLIVSLPIANTTILVWQGRY